ncbi:hypothetical protein [Dongia sp. agr-C8]
MTDIAAPPATKPSPHIAHWTLQAVTLPVRRAGRCGLAGLPFLILYAGGYLLHGGFYAHLIEPLSLVTMTVPALRNFDQVTQWMTATDGLIWALSLLTLAFWLCAWQRAVATGFREPVDAWLKASLRRMPQYLVVFGAWAVVGFVLFALSNALYTQNLWLNRFPVIDADGLPRARAPLTIILGLVGALYVYVRFAPLTALTAAGWDGSLAEVPRLTGGGTGPRLCLGFIALLFLSWAFCIWSRNGAALIYGKDWIGPAYHLTRLFALLTQIWLATLAALAAAPLASPRPMA